jgi:phosphoglycerate kinase
VLSAPRRPFLAIVGGAKVTDKIAVLENLVHLVDVLFIGGAMAYTFKKVLGELAIGGSLFDEEGAALVSSILAKAKDRKVPRILSASSFSWTCCVPHLLLRSAQSLLPLF